MEKTQKLTQKVAAEREERKGGREGGRKDGKKEVRDSERDRGKNKLLLKFKCDELSLTLKLLTHWILKSENNSIEKLVFFSTEEDPENLRGYKTSSTRELVGDHDSKPQLNTS